jgi:hypothetical protein
LNSEILITVSGDQVAVIQIYNEDFSVFLGRFVYDFNESKDLPVYLCYSGVIYISARSSSQSVYNDYFAIQSGKTKNICLIF